MGRAVGAESRRQQHATLSKKYINYKEILNKRLLLSRSVQNSNSLILKRIGHLMM